MYLTQGLCYPLISTCRFRIRRIILFPSRQNLQPNSWIYGRYREVSDSLKLTEEGLVRFGRSVTQSRGSELCLYFLLHSVFLALSGAFFIGQTPTETTKLQTSWLLFTRFLFPFLLPSCQIWKGLTL